MKAGMSMPRAQLTFTVEIRDLQTYLEVLNDVRPRIEIVDDIVGERPAAAPPIIRRRSTIGRHTWTKEEDRQLLQWHKEGVSRALMARRLGVRYSQAGARLIKLLDRGSV